MTAKFPSPDEKPNASSARRKRRRQRPMWFALALTMGTAAAVVLLGFWFRSDVPTPSRSGAIEVPLGVEEAAIVRYRGPQLKARPYRRGSSINVRIARQERKAGVVVYDLRYVVNQPGDFDLVDYLTTVSGQPPTDLPAFRVRGMTQLTKDLETRIQEIEQVEIHIPHLYYETLSGLGLLWGLWLIGLVFVGRRPGQGEQRQAPPPPSLEQRIRVLLERLRHDDLSIQENALLEQLLLQHWAEQSGATEARLAEACRQLRNDSTFSDAYAKLQAYMHHRESGVTRKALLEASLATCSSAVENTKPQNNGVGA